MWIGIQSPGYFFRTSTLNFVLKCFWPNSFSSYLTHLRSLPCLFTPQVTAPVEFCSSWICLSCYMGLSRLIHGFLWFSHLSNVPHGFLKFLQYVPISLPLQFRGWWRSLKHLLRVLSASSPSQTLP